MNQQKEIIAEIAKHLAVTPQDIDLHSSIETDLGLGPLEKADLLSVLAQKFNINFDSNELEEVDTINDLVVLIEDLLIE